MAARDTREPVGILILASVFRDDFPWLYELGMEAYRKARSRNSRAAQEALHTFRSVAKYTLVGPWSRELSSGRKELYYLLEELPFLLGEFLHEPERAGGPRGDNRDAGSEDESDT